MVNNIARKGIKTRIKKIAMGILYRFPIQKNKVVFLNYYGKGYGDSPKYIAKEIFCQNLPWKIIWLVKGDVYVPSKIKKVYIYGVRSFYELSTAKVIISNCKSNIPFGYVSKKKKKQYYLQTWHGDFGPKYIEKEIEDSFDPSYIITSKADSAATNAILSGNTFFSKVLKESFWLPEHCVILESGIPRNDIYFKGDEFKNKLKEKFGFSKEDKILLYAPTFRDDYDTRCYNIDFVKVRMLLEQLKGETWKIIIRLHPNIASRTDLFHFDANIIDGSLYPDQQELCLISDCLITDYSSIMADFMLMKKPVFLYATDLEKYSDKNAGRGLRDMYYHLPFTLSSKQEDLERDILKFNTEEYAVALDAFMQEYYCTFDDGHASERVVNHLKAVLGA